MEYNEIVTNQEFELDFKGIIIDLLRNRRKIILLGLIAAIIVACGVFCLGMIELNDVERVERLQIENEKLVEYTERMVEATREKMDVISAQIDAQEDYLNKSIYMDIDYNQIRKAEIRYFIKTDYEIMPEMTYQNVDWTDAVINAYVTLLTEKEFINTLALEYGVELRHIQELVSVYKMRDSVLAIDVIADTDERLNHILSYMLEGVENNRALIEDTVDEFELSELSRSEYIYKDTNVLTDQQAQKDTLSASLDLYTKEQEQLDSLLKTHVNTQSYGLKSTLKKSIKLGIVAAVAGCVMACAIIAVMYVSSDRLYSVAALKHKIKVPIIGLFTTDIDKKQNRIDKWLDESENRSAYNAAVGYELIAAYIKNVFAGGGSVLIAGQAPETQVEEVASAVANLLPQYSIINGGNLLSDPKPISELGKNDAIVLVEKCGCSRYSSIVKEVELAYMFNVEVLGCYIVERQ